MVQLVVIAGVSMAVACLVTNASLSWSISLAERLGALDRPGGRKDQPSPTPRLGGVAIVLGVLAGIASVAWFAYGLGGFALRQILAGALGGAIVFTIGLYDDLYGLSPVAKFAGQGVAAILLVSVGIRFNVFAIPFLGEVQLGVLAVAVSVLWIVGVTNAINLIDGLDGLGAGTVAIIASSFAIYSVVNGQSLSLVLSASAIGASIAFLKKNWHPAKVFMGDSGSLTLGFLLAAVSVHSSLKTSTTMAILVPALALGVPVIDTLLVMARRFSHHPSSSPFKRLARVFRADRNHVHHLLLFFGGSRTRIVLSLYAMVAASCAFSLAVALAHSVALGIALVVLEVVVLLAVRHSGAVLKQNGAQKAPNLPTPEYLLSKKAA